jgi:hypothetical protein
MHVGLSHWLHEISISKIVYHHFWPKQIPSISYISYFILRKYEIWLEHFVSNYSKQTNINFFHLVFFVQFSTKKKFVANFHKKHSCILFSSTNIIHPWMHGKIFFHVTKYFVLNVKRYSPNISSMWAQYSKKIQSCSFVHAHTHRLMK